MSLVGFGSLCVMRLADSKPVHVMWLVDFQPLVCCVTCGFGGCLMSIKQTIQRETLWWLKTSRHGDYAKMIFNDDQRM